MDQAYSTAIEILVNGTPDYRAIGIALAKQDPATFVALHNKTDVANAPKWVKDTISFLRSDNLINAIKETRAATGLGLRDAKAVVDHVAHKLNLRDTPSIQLDSNEQRALVDQLVAYAMVTR